MHGPSLCHMATLVPDTAFCHLIACYYSDLTCEDLQISPTVLHRQDKAEEGHIGGSLLHV